MHEYVSQLFFKFAAFLGPTGRPFQQHTPNLPVLRATTRALDRVGPDSSCKALLRLAASPS
jgi:hypothetical protein